MLAAECVFQRVLRGAAGGGFHHAGQSIGQSQLGAGFKILPIGDSGGQILGDEGDSLQRVQIA